MLALSKPSLCSLHKKGSEPLLFGFRSLAQTAAPPAALPRSPSCLVPPVVVYTPVLPRPFAPVCEMWTLPSGWQVTETCEALQSVKTQSVHGTVSRWDGLATCNTSQGGAQGKTNGCF